MIASVGNLKKISMIILLTEVPKYSPSPRRNLQFYANRTEIYDEESDDYSSFFLLLRYTLFFNAIPIRLTIPRPFSPNFHIFMVVKKKILRNMTNFNWKHQNKSSFSIEDEKLREKRSKLWVDSQFRYSTLSPWLFRILLRRIRFNVLEFFSKLKKVQHFYQMNWMNDWGLILIVAKYSKSILYTNSWNFFYSKRIQVFLMIFFHEL